MSNQTPITKDQFIKRLTNLCFRSGLSGMPKDPTDQQILLKSAMLIIGEPRAYTEKEINERLDLWVLQVSQSHAIDRVTLRRYLIDTGYLTRSSDGSQYQVAQPEPHPELFEADIQQINIVEAAQAVQEEIARKKKEYLKKQKGNPKG